VDVNPSSPGNKGFVTFQLRRDVLPRHIGVLDRGFFFKGESTARVVKGANKNAALKEKACMKPTSEWHLVFD
jgi:hypothetical protein